MILDDSTRTNKRNSLIAVFKEIPVPSRLSTIVEGETLFNDAAALVGCPSSFE